MTFAKPALTVTRDSLVKAGIDLGASQALLPISEAFWHLPTQISDRALCETDPSLQQLLPYITVFNEEGKIFVYGRGAKGGEQRLVGKLSLGLGGHVDTPTPVAMGLQRHLLGEAQRELSEEASLKNPYIVFEALISDQLPDGNAVPVGSVHLGLWGATVVQMSDVGELEDGIILNGDWMDLEQAAENFDRFENWSRMIIRELQHRAQEGV